MKNGLINKLLPALFFTLVSYNVSAVTDLKLSDYHCP